MSAILSVSTVQGRRGEKWVSNQKTTLPPLGQRKRQGPSVATKVMVEAVC